MQVAHINERKHLAAFLLLLLAPLGLNLLLGSLCLWLGLS